MFIAEMGKLRYRERIKHYVKSRTRTPSPMCLCSFLDILYLQDTSTSTSLAAPAHGRVPSAGGNRPRGLEGPTWLLTLWHKQ